MKKRIIAILLAALMLLTACGKASDTPTPTDDTQPTSESTPTQSTDAPTEPTSAPTEPEATEPTPAPTEGEDDFTITEIGTYENIEDEFAGYDIYQNERYSNNKVEVSNQDWKEISHKAFSDDPFLCAVRLDQPSNSGYVLERGDRYEEVNHTKLFAFGKIYDIRNTYFYWTSEGSTFQTSNDLVIIKDYGSLQSILIYPGGFQKVDYSEEDPACRVEYIFNSDDDIIEYFRYNRKFADHYICYNDLQQHLFQNFALMNYSELSDEELDNAFMLEYGTLEIIDGAVQLQPIETYTLEEWSHSRFCKYAKELAQYECRLNELYGITNNPA